MRRLWGAVAYAGLVALALWGPVWLLVTVGLTGTTALVLTLAVESARTVGRRAPWPERPEHLAPRPHIRIIVPQTPTTPIRDWQREEWL